MDKRLTIREITLFAVLGALTFALQVAMAPLPNIEPVSLLVMIYAATFGWKCLYPVYVFVVMEILFYGISTWNVYYLYVWTVLAFAAILMRGTRQPLAKPSRSSFSALAATLILMARLVEVTN